MPSNAPDLSVLAGQFGFAVRMAQLQVFERFHRRLWRRHRLHPGAFSVLVAVSRNPGIRPGALADALSIKRPNMTKLLDLLVRRGWIERRSEARDGRGVCLWVAPRAARKLARVIAEARANDVRSTAALSTRERAQLLKLLNKLVAGPAP